MLSDVEIETLAKDILTHVIASIAEQGTSLFHEILEMDSGELIPVYGGTSPEGYGSFLCEFMPLATVKTIITTCERIFDDFTISVANKQTGESANKRISERHLPRSRDEAIKIMAECTTLYLITSFRARLCDLIDEAVKDCEVISKVLLASILVEQLKGVIQGKITADARTEIDEAVERVANKKRDLLRKTIKKTPHILAERGKGRPSKSPIERELESKDYITKIENAYHKLRHETGNKPTKTMVAKELGEGGLNLRTGIDSSLTAFGNKLRRLKIDYDAIVRKAEDELNNNS